jgi:hypothetical protein
MAEKTVKSCVSSIWKARGGAACEAAAYLARHSGEPTLYRSRLGAEYQAHD